MEDELRCPGCQDATLSFLDYDSLMVLRHDLALFTLTCPHCQSKVTALHGIPRALKEEIRFAAIEIGAGMGE